MIIASLNEFATAVDPATEVNVRAVLENHGVILPQRLRYVQWANTSLKFSYSEFGPITVVDLNDLANPFPTVVAQPSAGGMFNQGAWSPDDSKLVFWGHDSDKASEKDGIFTTNSDGSGTPVRLGNGQRASWKGPEQLD